MTERVVVGAVLVDDLDRPTRLLTARRTRPADLAGGWEFPGGKVEPGEDVRAAVIRELAEELGVRIAVGAEIVGADPAGWPLPQDYRLRLFWAHTDDRPRLRDGSHDEVRWLTASSLTEVAWLPADLDAVRLIGESLAAAAPPPMPSA